MTKGEGPAFLETNGARGPTHQTKNGGTANKPASVYLNARAAATGGASSYFCERKIRAASKAK